MKYVYILESLDSEHFYVGITDDLRSEPHFQIRTLEDQDLCRIQR